VIELQGNLWNMQGDWLCITTNGVIRKDGTAVMGRGIALQAKERIPEIDKFLASSLTVKGNVVAVLGRHDNKWIIAFPTKHHWKDDSTIELIRTSAIQLKAHFDKQIVKPTVLLPRPGCANGNLRWTDVKRVIEPILDDDHFIVVSG
jgi:hypothetical protein